MPLESAFFASVEGTGACNLELERLLHRYNASASKRSRFGPGKAPAASWEIISESLTACAVA